MVNHIQLKVDSACEKVAKSISQFLIYYFITNAENKDTRMKLTRRLNGKTKEGKTNLIIGRLAKLFRHRIKRESMVGNKGRKKKRDSMHSLHLLHHPYTLTSLTTK